MKIRIFILLASVAVLSGCRGYIGGFDDSNLSFVQVVLMNRSGHDIEMRFNETGWSAEGDTIRLESGNGLWKYDFTEEVNSNVFFEEMEMVIDGEERIIFDSQLDKVIPCNPCSPGSWKNVSDSKGQYFIYDFNETVCERIMKGYSSLKTFRMNRIPPSGIMSDTLCAEGSSEALFYQLFPVPSIREDLRLGAVVSKEAESIDRIVFHEGTVPGKIVTEEHHSGYGRMDSPCFTYHSMEELRKAGLAHFGCDFAELSGRGRMEKFTGCLYSYVEVDHTEQLQETRETTDYIWNMSLDKAFVTNIEYGRVKILFAEADCSSKTLSNYLYYNVLTNNHNDNYTVDEIDYHLIGMDENGKFFCQSGGEELVRAFLEASDGLPAYPVSFCMTDAAGNSAHIHIDDVE